jgi:hypothetical protein
MNADNGFYPIETLWQNKALSRHPYWGATTNHHLLGRGKLHRISQ